MKESFDYEHHSGEIKKSIGLGVRCLGIVFDQVVKENEDVYKYTYYEMRRGTTQRIQQIRELLKGV